MTTGRTQAGVSACAGWRRLAGGPLMLLGASTLWGTVGTAQALAATGADPPVVGAARLASGAVALVAVGLALGGRSGLARAWAPGARSWTLCAGVVTAVYQATFFAAVARTGVALGTLVALASAPVLCGLLARRVAGERLPRGWLGATACAVAGCALLLAPGADASADAIGVALALVAGACYAVYTVCAKRLLSAGVDPLPILAGSVATGALVLAPVLAAGAAQLVSARGLALVAWLGLAATATGYVLFARGLARVPAAAAGTLSLAEPLTASLLGVIVLGERPAPAAAGGALLLAAGLGFAVRVQARGPRRASTTRSSPSESVIGSRPAGVRPSALMARPSLEPARSPSPSSQ
jgi:DME family drug/metabolite transporter